MTNEKYEISVIIPAYNVEKYIDECFDSLINQTFKNFEIIVINDGSTDATKYMLEQYEKIMNNLTVINQKNSGSPGGPRNIGIKLARGKYIFMLDPDDVLPYGALEVLYNAAEKSKSEVVAGNYIRFNSKRSWTVKHISKNLFAKERIVKFEDEIFLLCNGVTCNKLYKTSFLKEHNISYDEVKKNGEDKPFMLDVYFYASKIHLIPNIVYKYREREDAGNKSTTQELSFEIFSQSLDAIVDNYNTLVDRGRKDLTKGLFVQERVQHDLIRFINYYSKEYKNNNNKEWETIFNISYEYIKIISDKMDLLPYMQRVKIYNIIHKNHDEIIKICEKERHFYYYSIDKVNDNWIINDKKYDNTSSINYINNSDLILKHNIENLQVTNNSLSISGYAFFNRLNINDKKDYSKYIIVKGINGSKKYELDSFDRNDINIKFGKMMFSYKWSGMEKNIDITELEEIVSSDNPSVEIYLYVKLSDKLYKEIYITSLEIFNYINKINNKIINRIDRVLWTEEGIKLLGWSNILYCNNDEEDKFIKTLIIKDIYTEREKSIQLTNKINNWYNNQFETNPYKFNYQYGGWECIIPYKVINEGRHYFFIEIKSGKDTIREKLMFTSFSLLKDRLNIETNKINYKKIFKFELTTSEDCREKCELELYVNKVNNEFSQLNGGYIPTIGKKMTYWDYKNTEQIFTIGRIKVEYENLILEGISNKSIEDEEVYIKLKDNKDGIKRKYKLENLDKLYNETVLNGWQVVIPYKEIQQLQSAKFIIESDSYNYDKFKFTNRLNNNTEVWNKLHYIKNISINLNKIEYINSDEIGLEVNSNSNIKIYLKGIIIKSINKTKKIIKSISNKVPYYIKIKNKIKRIMNANYNFVYKTFCIFPCKKNKIIMLGYPEKITPNFKPIFNKLNSEYKEFNVKYIGGNAKNIIQVIKLMYDIASSKTILLNDYYRHIYPLNIRKDTKVIQVWHATGIFKKFGLLASGKNDSNKEEFEINAHKSYTHVITSSEYVRKPYADAFGLSIEKTLSLGVARTDIFFDDNYKTNICNKLFEKFPYLKDKKIILYAPTFRGSSVDRKKFRNQIEFNKLKELKDKGYVILIKLHPLVQEKFEIPFNMKDFVYDFTKYPDINDLFFISNILITDYSSNIFEFALLKKPILLFAYDLEKYLLERGFYDDYEEMVPGPICKTTEELLNEIKGSEDKKVNYDEFIEKYIDKCDGNSTERIIKLITNDK